MNETRTTDLTTGSIPAHLRRLTVPMIWGILAIIGFNVVDTFFVAQLGTLELAAMSFTFPVVSLFSSIAIGLGAGATAVIANAIGEKDTSKVRRLTSDSLVLSTLIVFVLCVAGILTIDPLFRLLGATDETLPLIERYMKIWYIGMVFLVVPMVGNAAIRASGDTLIPSYIMIFAAILNCFLDPLLIFGWGPVPRLEIEGAAIATVIARMTTLVAILLVLHFKKRMLTLSRPKCFQTLVASWWSILRIGLPAATSNGINPFVQGIITTLVASFGAEAVAGYGIATRIEMLSIIVVLAMTASLPPFVGQNWGAQKFGRALQAMKLSHYFSLAYGFGLAVILAVFAGPISRLFDANEVVISSSVLYLSIVPITYGVMGIGMVSSSAFSALNRPMLSLCLPGLRAFLFLLPAAMILMRYFDLRGIYLGIVIANIFVGVLAWDFMRRIFRGVPCE